ncbi:hypothetical protein ACOMHN_062202 [Nucella lapillus]
MAVIVVVLVITLTNLAVSNPVYSSYNPSSAGGLEPPAQKPASREFQCVILEHPGPCGSTPSWRQGVTLPNLYGHQTMDQALAELGSVLKSSHPSDSSGDLVAQFLCTLFLPPCPRTDQGARVASQSGGVPPLPLPCRPLCEMARGQVQDAGQSDTPSRWPSDIRCHMFPTEKCFALTGQ